MAGGLTYYYYDFQCEATLIEGHKYRLIIDGQYTIDTVYYGGSIRFSINGAQITIGRLKSGMWEIVAPTNSTTTYALADLGVDESEDPAV